MIQVYNRKTGQLEAEAVSGEKWLHWLYETPSGRFTLEAFVKRRWYSFLSGFWCDSSFSRGMIRPFIEKYGIDMAEALDEPEDYISFNDFFSRHLKPEARPFPQDPQLLPSPGDGRLQVFPEIHPDRIWQIKGSGYRLKDLVPDRTLCRQFAGGSCALLRLAPTDYHRFHCIADGRLEAPRRIRGQYYSVNPIALRQVGEVFCRNTRMLTLQHRETGGDILYVEVGATSVGSIVQMYPEGGAVFTGDEKGFFKFGGSTILLFFEPDQVIFDGDLLEHSGRGIETRIVAGETIGRWKR